MFTNLIGLWVVRVPMVILFGSVMHLNITFVWWVFNIDQWIRLLLSFFYYRRYDIADTVHRNSKCSLQEGCI
jgi:Na+-driven multidrug efflux pump